MMKYFYYLSILMLSSCATYDSSNNDFKDGNHLFEIKRCRKKENGLIELVFEYVGKKDILVNPDFLISMTVAGEDKSIQENLDKTRFRERCEALNYLFMYKRTDEDTKSPCKYTFEVPNTEDVKFHNILDASIYIDCISLEKLLEELPKRESIYDHDMFLFYHFDKIFKKEIQYNNKIYQSMKVPSFFESDKNIPTEDLIEIEEQKNKK